MPTPAQAGAAVATAGVLSAGSYGVYHYTTSGEETKKQEGKDQGVELPITYKDELNITTPYNLGVLSVPTNKEKLVKTTVENKDWWNDVFTKRLDNKKTGVSTNFSGVTVGYGDTNSLNKACDAAYKKVASDFAPATQGQPENTLLKEITKYCTKDAVENSITAPSAPAPQPAVKPTGTVPVLATSDTTSTGTYTGKLISFLQEANIPKLVKPKDGEITQQWWKWAYENKFVKHTEKTTLDPIFSEVKEGYADNAKPATAGTTVKQTALNQACDAAYKTTKEDKHFTKGDHLLDNISEFCNNADTKVDISEPKFVIYTSPESDHTNGVVSIDANKAYLIKTTNDNNNNLWWLWSFSKNFDETNKATAYDTIFQQVTAGYGDNTTQHLNKACHEAYKKAYADFKAADSKLLSSISKLCTKGTTNPALDKPEPAPAEFVLGKNTSATHAGDLYKNGNKEANKEKLVDPTKGEDWWNWSFETRVDKYKVKSKLPATFAKVTQGYESSDTASEDNRIALNTACKDAYGKDKAKLQVATETKQLLEFVKEFCAIKGTTELNITQ